MIYSQINSLAIIYMKHWFMFQLAINGESVTDTNWLLCWWLQELYTYKVVKDDTQKLNLILFTYNQLVGFTGWGRGISLVWGASAWVSHIWGIPVSSLEWLEACGHTTKPMRVHQDRSLEWDQCLGGPCIPSAWAAAVRERRMVVFISHFGLRDNSHDTYWLCLSRRYSK